MINIPFNEAESIFEPFYDGGESYPDHEKFSPLSRYTVTIAPGTVGTVKQGWASVDILIEGQKSAGYVITMERDCDLDVSDYDIFRLFGNISGDIRFRVRCVIDGKEQTVMERNGFGTNSFEGKISGRRMTHYALDFALTGRDAARAGLTWLGFVNEKRCAEMDTRKSPYTSEWDGCFVKNPTEIKPVVGMFFSAEEMDDLRKKINQPPFLDIMEKLREKAAEAMLLEPEPYITDYVPGHDQRWNLPREIARPLYQQDAEILAFIGLMDNNMDMLKMACRKALSLAVTPHWTEEIIGRLPGATWHHRSFTEDVICRICCLVLDWAGSLLTWHGKNIIYNALMLKGLPRFQSDFYSVDYIWEMNQGIVFNHGRIMTLLTLANRYPRYEALIDIAARDERTMVDKYVLEDGGTREGPSYWNYTFGTVIPTVYLLARHYHMTMEEYAWDRLKRTGEYALAMLSDAEDGSYYLPVNDANLGQYSAACCSGFCRISKDIRWKQLYSRIMNGTSGDRMSLEALLMCDTIEKIDGEISGDGFSSLNTIGHTSLRRTTEDVGRVHFYVGAGPNYFGHCHGDKGQIILEANHKPLLIDRGKCDFYASRCVQHNIFMPEAPEGEMAYSQNVRIGVAPVLRSSYENGVLDYETDTTRTWDEGIVEKSSRIVRSEDAHVYVIYDEIVNIKPLKASFRLNTYGEITKEGNSYKIIDGDLQVTVTPVNYIPEKVFADKLGRESEGKPVNELIFYLAEVKEHKIATLIEVSRKGENKCRLADEHTMIYGEKKFDI